MNACVERTCLFANSHSSRGIYNLADNNVRWRPFLQFDGSCQSFCGYVNLSAASLKHSTHKYGYFQFDRVINQPNPFACNARALVNKAQRGTAQRTWPALRSSVPEQRQTAVIWGHLAIMGCTAHLAQHGGKRGPCQGWQTWVEAPGCIIFTLHCRIKMFFFFKCMFRYLAIPVKYAHF